MRKSKQKAISPEHGEIVIENGIPAPGCNRDRSRTAIRKAMANMKVGDSFFYRNGYHQLFAYAARREGIKIQVRRVVGAEGDIVGMRVWRIA